MVVPRFVDHNEPSTVSLMVYQDQVRYGRMYDGLKGVSRPDFATFSTKHGIFTSMGPIKLLATTAQIEFKDELVQIRDGLTNAIAIGEPSLTDRNFAKFIDFNNNSSLKAWSWWYPVGGDNDLQDFMCRLFPSVGCLTAF